MFIPKVPPCSLTFAPLSEGVSASVSRRSAKTIFTSSIAALAFAVHTQAADAIFSNATVDPTNPDGNVGLSINKTYDARY
ncbi:MAG: hypothetical protein JWL90_1874 [Chthoniobacteraceae bacterium]|nr:hypothetical protein [Chthoniobacteraceae bacterium]